ncbi:MAG: hypothetical protein JJ922_02910 [Parvibaculum sp.]|nr:hypothetical protein [Parvibaculum sp.]MBO6690942.1 hypothetical protein [Parvibaculum sp.]MBO6713084.1 hypothetical protein [Parvibaculum sp.]
MIIDFCRQKLPEALTEHEIELMQRYLALLVSRRQLPPYLGHRPNWPQMAEESGIEVARLRAASRLLKHGLEALIREIPKLPPPEPHLCRLPKPIDQSKRPKERHSTDTLVPIPRTAHPRPPCGSSKSKPGPKPRPIVEFPQAASGSWEDPADFPTALALHMQRHGDSCWQLCRSIVKPVEAFDRRTVQSWVSGDNCPATLESFEILRRIELRYRLPVGYFRSKLSVTNRSTRSLRKLEGVSTAERRRLAWHLPEDFDLRSREERQEIIDWVRRVIITGTTDYRKYQAAAMKHRFAIRFPGLLDQSSVRNRAPSDDPSITRAARYAGGNICAPPPLMEEMRELLAFKMSTLTAVGYQRTGMWGHETASQKLEHLGLMLGALAAAPDGPVSGYGVPIRNLTLALLAFPAVWDWYLRWRERKRGLFTAWEVDMLRTALAVTRKETGWLRQNPKLAEHLDIIPGLISEEDISRANNCWNLVCDEMYTCASRLVKEIERVARVHRDPFEPILVVLESESPLGEYRKITEEISQSMPDERRYPVAAAEGLRSFLMLRIGLHSGLRQKNLRQMLYCPPGEIPASERNLSDLRRGQLRWNTRENAWKVFIPSSAFKNANSSYFGNKPYQLRLPDLGGLYEAIERYTFARPRLLHSATDPQAFFVKTVKKTSADAAYDQTTFYEAWRLTIQRYGIFNPYTGRGAIEGLLPHGPHNVRDVLATHILKKTGSYEQASYAIQDTPEMVAKHYGRFLPQDKAALAAKILNKVWEHPA